MSLQVRLTHSLGERLIELDARGADQPAIVGRAQGAQVPVPSASVGKQHCLLFVHEDRWVVQDAGSQAGTFLNGERISDPSFLNSGDVISLGAGSTAPSLLIDPHGLGVSEESTQSSLPAAPAPLRRPAAPAPNLPQPGGYAPSYSAPPQPEIPAEDNIFGAPEPAYQPPAGYPSPAAQPRPHYGGRPSVPGFNAPGAYAAPEVQTDAWGNPIVASDAPRKRLRKKKQGTNPAIIVGVAVIGLIAVVVLVVIVVQKQKENATPIVIIQPAAPSTAAAAAKPSSIFENTTGSGKPVGESSAATKPKAALKPPASPRVRPPAAASPEIDAVTPAMDTKKSDPKYQPIDEARLLIDTGKPGIALARLLELEESDNPFKKEIADFKDQAYDRIWWLRISELLDERIKYNKEIADRKQQLKEAADPEFKAGLQKEITQIETRLTSVQDTLKTMQYAGAASPKDLKDSELATLKSQRDDEKFKSWRSEVEASIRRSHGERLPWRSNS